MDAAAEIGRNPVSKHQIQPEYEDDQADAGRDASTRLARQNSQAHTGTGKYSSFPVQLTTSRIGNLTRLIHTLLYVMTIRTYIHTYCAGGISAVNAIDTQLRDPINSRLIRWRMAVLNKLMDVAAELGRNSVS